MQLEGQNDAWDDTLLIKAYDDSIKLVREELACRIASSTNKDASHSSNDNLNSHGIEMVKTKNEYQVGDYVRATYDDGKDYEAIILEIDTRSGTCLLKYIGYENEQNTPLDNLIPSWGKKARRLQFAKSKFEDTEEMVKEDKAGIKTPKRNKTSSLKTIPPPPPMPPMLSDTQNCEDSEHLSAMLMSWYMSGYYTGVYQGMQIAKSKSASKNKKK